jgi:hypothetical protein
MKNAGTITAIGRTPNPSMGARPLFLTSCPVGVNVRPYNLGWTDPCDHPRKIHVTPRSASCYSPFSLRMADGLIAWYAYAWLCISFCFPVAFANFISSSVAKFGTVVLEKRT